MVTVMDGDSVDNDDSAADVGCGEGSEMLWL